MMKMNPYLNFAGNCRDALAFYAEAFGGRIESMMTFGETPAGEHVPPDWHGKIMHAHLTTGDLDLMAQRAARERSSGAAAARDGL